jgi:hypothetical protein
MCQQGHYFIQVTLNVTLQAIDPETAQNLVDVVHRECAYSKATNGSINMETNLVGNRSRDNYRVMLVAELLIQNERKCDCGYGRHSCHDFNSLIPTRVASDQISVTSSMGKH